MDDGVPYLFLNKFYTYFAIWFAVSIKPHIQNAAAKHKIGFTALLTPHGTPLIIYIIFFWFKWPNGNGRPSVRPSLVDKEAF